MIRKNYECCIIGAGPAGVGTALELTQNGVSDILIIDKQTRIGGLSRTEIFEGTRFDVGPHRFFTKNKEINHIWHETLGKDFIPVDRLTRIFYKKKLFNYPLKAGDALTKMGLFESAHAMLSFAAAKFTPHKPAETFEDWITEKFGRKIFETFFKTYTEKVWGIPCNQIGAEWAAQRIKGLDLLEVIKNSFSFNKSNTPKSLVEQFDYPRYGAGQMYEAIAARSVDKGAELMLGATVKTIRRQDNQITSLLVTDADGNNIEVTAKHYFNSSPLTHFFTMVDPLETDEITRAAGALYYRDHITVNLLIDGDNVFPDQWVYIHAPDVYMARLANYNNFSGNMVQGKKTALSVEYFVFRNDNIWSRSDQELISLAGDELAKSGLVERSRLEKGWVIRETESYPTYYLGYLDHYNILKSAMDRYVNLTPIGRGGLYKYNNQDHSMYSGLLAARNYIGNQDIHYNLWNINIDAEYHESSERETNDGEN